MQPYDMMFEPIESPQRPPRAPRRGGAGPLATMILGLALVVLCATAFALPSIVERLQYANTMGRERAEAEVARERLQNVDIDGLSRDFQSIPKAIGPSVVHINTQAIVEQRNVADELFPFGGGQPFERRGQGSGIIVDTDGYIVTNYHVVKDANEITVTLSDGRRRSAEIVGVDPLTDLAVLKIAEEGLIAAAWGDSERLDRGSFVWALGSPFGLDHSITFGIVSAKGRDRIGDNPYQSFLQTDAAVNPGNSGGPLVNIRGEIIGINTAIIGQSYQGISFAIPSSIAQRVYEQIRETGKVTRGWLGVGLVDVTPSIAKQLGLDEAAGVYVPQVVEGSPAAKSGLRVGDVIVRWNDVAIDQRNTLSRQIADTKIGSEAIVEVVRSGEPVTLEVRVGQRPSDLR